MRASDDHRREAVQPTDVPLLDKATGGGFPRPSAVSLLGPIGSGKSILVRELVANFLRQGCRVLYYCIDDPADLVRLELEDHHIAVSRVEEEGRLGFVDMFRIGSEKLAESLPRMNPEEILEGTLCFPDLLTYGREFALKPVGHPLVIVMDSVTPFFLLAEARRVFQFVQVMRYLTRMTGAVAVEVLHTEVLDMAIENGMVNLSDGIVEMARRTGEDLLKGGTLKVLRMGRSLSPSRGYYYQITSQGIVFSNTPLV